ncbi:hypothetical protein BN1708_020323, partial [Verticillium longisporum]
VHHPSAHRQAQAVPQDPACLHPRD